MMGIEESGKRHGVIDVSADEYPVPPRVVGRGAVFVEHRLKGPQVSESAYVAPTAVLAGDVTIGPHSRVLFGAVITAEGGPVEIGTNCVVMENAVIRGVPNQETRVGDEVVIGPHAHLTGCVIVQRGPHRDGRGGRVQCRRLRQHRRPVGRGGTNGLVRRR
jgi:acetyltransferase-like isoleucine patch superfamily enzyme